MMGRVALLLLLAGCGFSSPKGTPDAPGDADPSCTPWDTRGGHVKELCPLHAPGPAWQITSGTVEYDTDTGMANDGSAPRSTLITQEDNLQLRVISVDNFGVAQGASLRVVGAHPLLVLSWSSIMVAGTIDVSSQRALPRPGAGGSRPGCNAAQDGQGVSNAGGGGGGGLNQGGKNGGSGNQMGNPGGMLGGSVPRPVGAVIGGCRGGSGGGGAAGGQGGHGGGAIQLTAQMAITIAPSSRIHAGGMGGAGAQGNGGGGGGGSGGYIGLDAPVVTTASGSILAANGGAGGAGCLLDTGAPGQDAQLMNMLAAGGAAGRCSSGADGGNGGARANPTLPTAGANSVISGGGGGGGAGYIIVWAPASGYTTAALGTKTPLEAYVTAVE